MAFKLINGSATRPGNTIMVDGAPCTVRNNDISKTGKHGHAKCRIEAANMLTGSKKVFVVPGHDRFEVPMVNKNKAQILSIADGKISVMDLESFETIEIECPEELKSEISENSNVEYWDIEGQKIIKRKL